MKSETQIEKSPLIISRASKKATATLDSLRRIFTIAEDDHSTLGRIERELSRNLTGFLREHIVSTIDEPEDIEREFIDTKIPEEPRFVSDHTEFLMQKVVAHSVHTASPSFIGHMTSALPHFMLPLTKIMFALNQNMVKIETAKSFTPLERQVIGMLHRLAYERTDEYYQRNVQNKDVSLGVFCGGGTTANITALWVARNRMLGPKGDFQSISATGLVHGLITHGLRGLAVLVSKRGHYSLKKAADILGIGTEHLIAVETDHANRMDVSEARQIIARLRRDQIGVLAIIGIAGTTETGNVDPLPEIGKLAHDEGIHFHVDAAWGGPTLFSTRYRSLLDGIAMADSITVDAHKQLYVPMGAGVILFKDESALTSIEQVANYIIRRGSRDLGKRSLEGSRPGMALLVHAGLCIVGRQGYELLIDLGIGKAKQFAKMIQSSDDFELVTEPELNLLTYRFVPEYVKTRLAELRGKQLEHVTQLLNELTVKIQKEQRAAGKTFVSRTTLEPHQYQRLPTTVFRVVLANPLTTRQVLSSILDEQLALGRATLASGLDTRLRAALEV